jgi:hypothetical protein
MIVASKDFPVPEESLCKRGDLEVRHETSTPQGIPAGCVGVVSVTKMSSHLMSQRARRLANEARLPFGNANSASGVIRLAQEWGLVTKVEKMQFHPPSSIISGGVNDNGGVEIIVRDPAPEVPMFIPTDADDLTDLVPGPFINQKPPPQPFEELVMKKKMGPTSAIDASALLVAGLQPGPYMKKMDLYLEACKYEEFGKTKATKKGPWTYPNWARKDGIHDTAVDAGIITITDAGLYRVEHDPTVRLTRRGSFSSPPETSTLVKSPFFDAGLIVLKKKYADIERIIQDKLLSESAVEKVGVEAFEKFMATMKNGG